MARRYTIHPSWDNCLACLGLFTIAMVVLMSDVWDAVKIGFVVVYSGAFVSHARAAWGWRKIGSMTVEQETQE